MRRRWWTAAVAAIGIASGALAAGPDEKPPEGPKPPAETEKLSYFVGPWTTEGEVKPGPLGPGGPSQGREMCRWMPGKFFLVCLMQTRTPSGVVQMEGIMGYDADRKVYQWWSFDSLGRTETATGTVKDDAWTWLGESKVGDKTVRTRYTVSDTKPDGYSYDLESSADGKLWTSMMTGKVAKMVPKPPTTPAATHPVGTPPVMIRIPTPAPTPK